MSLSPAAPISLLSRTKRPHNQATVFAYLRSHHTQSKLFYKVALMPTENFQTVVHRATAGISETPPKQQLVFVVREMSDKYPRSG